MAPDELKAAKKVIGIKQVMKSVAKGAAKEVFFAHDADERVIQPLRELCATKNISVNAEYSLKELGKACMIEVGAAAVAVL